jgi:hypothetical protein
MCWRLDNAVSSFGRWVDNRLAERDEEGRQLYTIEALLLPPKRPVIAQSRVYES